MLISSHQNYRELGWTFPTGHSQKVPELFDIPSCYTINTETGKLRKAGNKNQPGEEMKATGDGQGTRGKLGFIYLGEGRGARGHQNLTHTVVEALH